MIVQKIRHDWPENAGFLISRPQGLQEYTFLHFLTPVTIRIGDALIEAHPGACIFYSPGTAQWFYSSVPLVHNWMHADSAMSSLLQQYNIPEDTLLYPSSTDFISELFHQMEVENLSELPYRQPLSDLLLQQFLILFSRDIHGNTAACSLAPRTRETLKHIRQQILSFPEKPWTVQSMAALAHLSTSRFHTLYRHLFGTSPMQDVISARINRAKHYLAQTQHPISAVAELSGYSDPYHFIRQFKTITGLTPGKFRKNRM